MEQVLFTIPLKTSWLPDGIPIHAFGMVLFVCFVVCTSFAARRAARVGFPPDRMQDLALVLFLTGLLGARITFMIQYRVPIEKFFHIWEGGIVFFGSAIGGFLGYWVFYFVVLKRLGVRTWQLADAIAPAIALGIGIGRVGCLLNGCCYGQVAPEGYPAIAFPLTTAPVREVVVEQCGYQTVTGFTVRQASAEDVRSVVLHVERGSNAQRAGLQPGDLIAQVNGRANGAVVYLGVPQERAEGVAEWYRGRGAVVDVLESPRPAERRLRVLVADPTRLGALLADAQKALQVAPQSLKFDLFREMLVNWPKGRRDLELVVERGGATATVQFTPRSLGLHPTQIYESISMGLLVLLLLAFYPFRRHDGQVFVLLILAYAAHRFLNEVLRDDTTPVAFNMTLSQNISLLMVLAGVVLEVWLRATQTPRRAAKAAPPESSPPTS